MKKKIKDKIVEFEVKKEIIEDKIYEIESSIEEIESRIEEIEDRIKEIDNGGSSEDEENYDEYLDDEGEVRIGNWTCLPSVVLKEMDEIAYNEGFNEFLNTKREELEAEKEELENVKECLEAEKEELETKLEEIEEEIEELEEED